MSEPSLPTIIVAEEMALLRDTLAAWCEASGQYAVVGQCSDGASAVDLIVRHEPAIAILDFNLPKLFTLEAVRKTRSANLSTKVVVLATRCDRKTVLEILRSGANAIVLRSGTGQHLRDALQQVLDGGIYVSPDLELEKVFVAEPSSDPDDPLETLSAREHQVFTLLVEGIRAKEIAARLELSPKTVDTYRASLMRKLDIHDIAGLVKFAIRRKLTATP
jgi:DNA-binding NarL/FixJ family response regulator